MRATRFDRRAELQIPAKATGAAKCALHMGNKRPPTSKITRNELTDICQVPVALLKVVASNFGRDGLLWP